MLINKMGSTQGKVFSQHDDRNWRPKEPNSNRWINIHTGTEAVETLLTFPSTEAAEQEMDRYEQRRNCPQFVAPVTYNLLAPIASATAASCVVCSWNQ